MTATPVDALKLLTVFVPRVQQRSSQLELFRNDKQQREVCIVDGRRKQINSERINLATTSLHRVEVIECVVRALSAACRRR